MEVNSAESSFFADSFLGNELDEFDEIFTRLAVTPKIELGASFSEPEMSDQLTGDLSGSYSMTTGNFGNDPTTGNSGNDRKTTGNSGNNEPTTDNYNSRPGNSNNPKTGNKDLMFDREVADELVLRTLPSLDRYASLPNRSALRGLARPGGKGNFYTLSEHHHEKESKPQRSHGGKEKGVEDRRTRPRSEFVEDNDNERSRDSSYQSKSYHDLDQLERKEMDLTWLPFKSFEHYLKEDAVDSAYQTGEDSLKVVSSIRTLSRHELRERIETFNNTSLGLTIDMDVDSGVYHGYIRVIFDVIRPVDIRTSGKTSSIYDINLCDLEQMDEDAPFLSFNLPRNYQTTVHVSSETTANKVIEKLLNKYDIINHSGQFALFEKVNMTTTEDEGPSSESASTVYLRKVGSEEHPLELCLCWTNQNGESAARDKRQFVLRENDAGEILWEAFSVPELKTFLEILDQEEEKHVRSIGQKYVSLRETLKERLKVVTLENYDFISSLSPKHRCA